MRRWGLYLLLGGAAWFAFLLVRLPATVAYGQVADSLAGVRFAGLSGTVWQGEAQQLQYRQRALGALDWSLSPFKLLLGKLGAEVRLSQQDAYLDAQGDLALSSREVRLSRLEGRLPMSLLQPYLTMLPLPLGGVVSLKLEQVAFDSTGRPLQADGRIVWNQAQVLAPQQLSLGDLQLSLQHAEDGSGIRGEIADSGGPLQMQAQLTLGADGRYRLTGKVKAREGAADGLRQSLGMLGAVDEQGFYALNFNGAM